VRGQVRSATPRPAGGGHRQAERAVQARPAPGVRPPAGVRQAGGPEGSRPALRAGRRSIAAAGGDVHG